MAKLSVWNSSIRLVMNLSPLPCRNWAASSTASGTRRRRRRPRRRHPRPPKCCTATKPERRLQRGPNIKPKKKSKLEHRKTGTWKPTWKGRAGHVQVAEIDDQQQGVARSHRLGDEDVRRRDVDQQVPRLASRRRTARRQTVESDGKDQSILSFFCF